MDELLTRNDMLQRPSVISSSLFLNCHICRQQRTHLPHVSTSTVYNEKAKIVAKSKDRVRFWGITLFSGRW